MTARPSQSLDDIFDELAARCDDDGYTVADESDLDQWAKRLGATWPKTLDIIGADLARRYAQSTVNYVFGDSLANDLATVLMLRHEQVSDGEWPSLFWEVYEAFDAGEWPPKDGDFDPVVRYTDPAIAEIIAKLI